MGTEGGDKCVDNVDKLRKKWWGGEKGTNPKAVCNIRRRQHGQGNFELAANFGYSSRGSADPRESLRKRRISKLALTAHLQDLPLAAPSGCNATKCCPYTPTGSLTLTLADSRLYELNGSYNCSAVEQETGKAPLQNPRAWLKNHFRKLGLAVHSCLLER